MDTQLSQLLRRKRRTRMEGVPKSQKWRRVGDGLDSHRVGHPAPAQISSQSCVLSRGGGGGQRNPRRSAWQVLWAVTRPKNGEFPRGFPEKETLKHKQGCHWQIIRTEVKPLIDVFSTKLNKKDTMYFDKLQYSSLLCLLSSVFFFFMSLSLFCVQ